MRKGLLILGAMLLLTSLACVTINVYFPEAEIKDLSQVIEEQIRKQAAERPDAGAAPGAESPAPAEPGAGNSSMNLFDLLLGATPAHAQSVAEPDVTNPAIRAIIASRAARLERIESFKRGGFVGENNKALLEARDLGGLTDLKARAELTKLIRDENQDREKLYREIAAATGVDASQVARIAETYAQTLRAESRAGDWVQLPDGTWKQK